MDDVRAVMDAAGSERGTLLGHSEGGNMCILFAATYPDRASALVLVGCYAKRIRSDDYPRAPAWDERIREIEHTERSWADPDVVGTLAPSRADDAGFVAWLTRYLRASASPKAGAGLLRMNSVIDVRDVLPAIRVPTTVVDLVAGSGIAFTDRGEHSLKGVPSVWQLFAVEQGRHAG
jgi:pimeloyl-ACP methyl ester carboxylesterase